MNQIKENLVYYDKTEKNILETDGDLHLHFFQVI